MTQSRTDNAIRNAAAGLALRVVSILSQFILRTVFLRGLGNEYAGIGGLFTDILSVLSLAELGLDSSMVYALYRPLAEQDDERVRALLCFYRRAFRFAGVGVMAAGMLCAPFLGVLVGELPAVHEDLRFIFLLYTFHMAIPYLLADRPVLLKAQQKGRIVSGWGIAAQCLECALSVWYLLTFRRFIGWLLLHLSVNLAKSIGLWFAAGRRNPSLFLARGSVLSRGDRRELLADLLRLTAYHVSGVAVYSTDSIFIARFLGPVQVAIVGNFQLIVNSVRTCAEQAAGAVKPSVGHLAATESTAKQRQIFDRMHFIAFYTACCSCVCLYTLLNAFVGDIWLDGSYRLPGSTVALIAANFYLAVMVCPVEAFRNANGLFRIGWIRPLSTALFNLLLDACLGRILGLNGIFLATAVSRLLTQVWFDPYLLFSRVFHTPVKRYYRDYLFQMALTAVLCALTAFLCDRLFAGGGLFLFALRAALSLVLPQPILFLLYRNHAPYREIRSFFLSAGKRMLKK